MSHELLPPSSKGIGPLERSNAASLPYAAVPLDLSCERRLAYWDESRDRIRKRLARAARQAMEERWMPSGELAGKISALLDSSLISSHEKRVALNQRYGNSDVLVNPRDERVVRAREGVATPADLLSILRDYPKLGSIELAKLSHPLDVHATKAMDDDVLRTIANLGGKVGFGAPRHKPKTLKPDIPAMTVLRKQTVGSLVAPAGDIEVICRRAFLVRGDDSASRHDPELGNRIIFVESKKLPAAQIQFEKITDRIEGYLPSLELHENLQWLQPIATSYYAKYKGIKNTAER